MRPVITHARSWPPVARWTATAYAALLAVAASASAQTEVYRWGGTEPTAFRFAAANERWLVLERDRDVTHQELVVLRAHDGAEVLRTEGMSLPAGHRYSVSQSWDLAMRPFLSGDRLLTFRAGEALVALDIPSGRELWRTPLPSRHLMDNALTVTDSHVAWADPDRGLWVFDASTGRRAWGAAMRPFMSGGCVALEPDGSATALTWDFEVVSWDASGVEQSRLTLAPDWGAHSVIRHGELAVVLGSRVHVVDVRTGTLVVESAPHEWTSGAIVGDDLIVASDGGVAALDPRNLRARWESPRVGGVAVATPSVLGIARENGVLTWLDPRTGAELASMSIGNPHHVHRYRLRVSWGVAGDLVLVRDPGGSFIVFAGMPAPAPPVRISGVLRINGRGRRGVLVQVGDQRVRSGAGGRFSARTSLRGVIRVSVTDDELRARARLPCALEVDALVDPTAPKRVSLDAIALDYECDAACRCD